MAKTLSLFSGGADLPKSKLHKTASSTSGFRRGLYHLTGDSDPRMLVGYQSQVSFSSEFSILQTNVPLIFPSANVRGCEGRLLEQR